MSSWRGAAVVGAPPPLESCASSSLSLLGRCACQARGEAGRRGGGEALLCMLISSRSNDDLGNVLLVFAPCSPEPLWLLALPFFQLRLAPVAALALRHAFFISSFFWQLARPPAGQVGGGKVVVVVGKGVDNHIPFIDIGPAAAAALPSPHQ